MENAIVYLANKEKKEGWVEVYCPVCTSRGARGLICKIKDCLSGEKFIQLRCKSCKEIVTVP